MAFYYVSGTGKTGFFGWDQSVSKFALFTDATISGEVVRIVTQVDPPAKSDPARQNRFERFCQLCHQGSNQSE